MTAAGRSATGTSPRCRSRQVSRSSRRNAPRTGQPSGARASRSWTSWAGDPTWLRTMPPRRTDGSKVAKPWTSAATEADMAAGVDHQHHRGVEESGHVGRRRRRPVGCAVEEAHHPFDDEHVGPGRRPAGQRRDPLGAAQPGVEVAGRPPTGQGVVAGIDEVGPDLGSRRPVPGVAQGGQEPGGDRGLSHPGVGAGYHQAGPEQAGGGRARSHGAPNVARLVRPPARGLGVSPQRDSVAPLRSGSRWKSGAVPPL